uniref:EamA domain-containing protein n=1 Tax=Zooxanthella nutricula TaxID=1333877 RepID=A0A7S2KKM9_9DINO|mmetsp:Transcript_48478/g.147492  ORF Transcript_48478/g.147492 Transcript_48478/m.147492 type:complete len:228 (+) Transcript_48478:3-686(+)
MDRLVLVASAADEPSNGGVPFLGYGLGLLSGAVHGTLFIASRKSHDVHPLVLTASACVQEGLAIALVPAFGLAQEAPRAVLWGRPFASLGLFFLYMFILFSSAAFVSVGAQLSPAAVGSTTVTSVYMSSSYICQVVFFEDMPGMGTMVGAALMLLAVVTMALAQRGNEEELKCKTRGTMSIVSSYACGAGGRVSELAGLLTLASVSSRRESQPNSQEANQPAGFGTF